jgi:hypothetical protein
MIELEVLLFGMLGMLTSLIMGFIVTEGKSLHLNALLVLQGALTGWVGGIIWVVLTGGLQVTLFALLIPVLLSAFFAFLILDRSSSRALGNRHISSRYSTIALAALFILAFGVAYTAMPTVYNSTSNTQQFTVSALDFNPDEQIVTVPPASNMPSNRVPMDVTYIGSSATINALSENPAKGMYYNFKIYFTPKTDWIKPYIKIGIYRDTNGNGKLDTGDVLWSDADYALATDNTNWRTNCIWKNNIPTYGASSSNGKLLPIIHANQITKTHDESQIKFLNTPDGFTPQVDMLSWDEKGLTEQIVSYASVGAGETTTIQGEAFCNPDNTGKNIIVVNTYCACINEPYPLQDSQPMEQKIISFTVSATPQDTTLMGMPLPGVALILGFLVVIAFVYVKREGDI